MFECIGVDVCVQKDCLIVTSTRYAFFKLNEANKLKNGTERKKRWKVTKGKVAAKE